MTPSVTLATHNGAEHHSTAAAVEQPRTPLDPGAWRSNDPNQCAKRAPHPLSINVDGIHSEIIRLTEPVRLARWDLQDVPEVCCSCPSILVHLNRNPPIEQETADDRASVSIDHHIPVDGELLNTQNEGQCAQAAAHGVLCWMVLRLWDGPAEVAGSCVSESEGGDDGAVVLSTAPCWVKPEHGGRRYQCSTGEGTPSASEPWLRDAWRPQVFIRSPLAWKANGGDTPERRSQGAMRDGLVGEPYARRPTFRTTLHYTDHDLWIDLDVDVNDCDNEVSHAGFAPNNGILDTYHEEPRVTEGPHAPSCTCGLHGYFLCSEMFSLDVLHSLSRVLLSHYSNQLCLLLRPM